MNGAVGLVVPLLRPLLPTIPPQLRLCSLLRLKPGVPFGRDPLAHSSFYQNRRGVNDHVLTNAEALVFPAALGGERVFLLCSCC